MKSLVLALAIAAGLGSAASAEWSGCAGKTHVEKPVEKPVAAPST